MTDVGGLESFRFRVLEITNKGNLLARRASMIGLISIFFHRGVLGSLTAWCRGVSAICYMFSYNVALFRFDYGI